MFDRAVTDALDATWRESVCTITDHPIGSETEIGVLSSYVLHEKHYHIGNTYFAEVSKIINIVYRGFATNFGITQVCSILSSKLYPRTL